jgi:hypothetical protein
MEKEGLQAAIDFTKYLLALAGGAIAFIIQPTFFANNPLLKTLGLLALVAFTICAISGLFLFSRGCVMLAGKNYDLNDTRIKCLGQTNVISFGVGFLLLALAEAIKLLSA